MADTYGTLQHTLGQFGVAGWLHEDILDVIYQIDGVETPLFDMTEDSVATQPLHGWNKRNLTLRSFNAQAEGKDYTTQASYLDPVFGTRVTNLCQVLSKIARVTRTAAESNIVGVSDALADQSELRAVELKTEMETSMLLQTFTSPGSAGGARKMRGLVNAATTNLLNYGSTTTIAESHLNILSNKIWNSGGRPQDILVDGYLKRRLDGFTAGSTKYIAAEKKQLINTISVYESAFHVVALHLSRDLRRLTAPTLGVTGRYRLIALDRSAIKKAWLHRPSRSRLPKLGDDIRAELLTEFTIEYGDEAAHGQLKAMRG